MVIFLVHIFCAAPLEVSYVAKMNARWLHLGDGLLSQYLPKDLIVIVSQFLCVHQANWSYLESSALSTQQSAVSSPLSFESPQLSPTSMSDSEDGNGGGGDDKSSLRTANTQ
jgi:hypothetical protein